MRRVRAKLAAAVLVMVNVAEVPVAVQVAVFHPLTKVMGEPTRVPPLMVRTGAWPETGL